LTGSAPENHVLRRGEAAFLRQDGRSTAEIFNLFDSKAHQIDYFYTSRLPGEPVGGVDDVHFHPVEPRVFRITAGARF
jgi:hypothetical protein